jgi:hypothetical protein
VLQLLAGTVIVTALCGCASDHRAVDRDASHVPELRDVRTIVGECLVTFYDDSGNEYFSRQNHRIDPSGQTIEITANEPQGMFRWQVSRGTYRCWADAAELSQSPASIINANILRTLLISFMVSDDSHGAEGEKVKMDGRWYVPIIFAADCAANTRVTLFKRANENTIDVVYVEDSKSHEIVIARVYNFEQIEGTQCRVPTKIEILQAKSLTAEPARTMQVHYRTLPGL